MAHLKARGAFIDLPTACHTGDIERVRELLRQDPSLANKIGAHEGYYLGAGAPLSNAAAVGRMDIVQLLLEHGADPNLPEEQFAPKGKALYSAVYHGHYEIAKLLLERGAFPNPPVESSGDALWVSREWRPDKRMEELLLSHGAKPAPEHRDEDWPTREHNWLRISPLHEAARKGDLKAAKQLLDAGADLTARDEHLRSTPLAWAAKFGQLEMVKFLLERGAPKSLPGRSVMGDAARVGDQARARENRHAALRVVILGDRHHPKRTGAGVCVTLRRLRPRPPPVLGGRSTVGHGALDAVIGVQIPASQPAFARLRRASARLTPCLRRSRTIQASQEAERRLSRRSREVAEAAHGRSAKAPSVWRRRTPAPGFESQILRPAHPQRFWKLQPAAVEISRSAQHSRQREPVRLVRARDACPTISASSTSFAASYTLTSTTPASLATSRAASLCITLHVRGTRSTIVLGS